MLSEYVITDQYFKAAGPQPSDVVSSPRGGSCSRDSFFSRPLLDEGGISAHKKCNPRTLVVPGVQFNQRDSPRHKLFGKL